MSQPDAKDLSSHWLQAVDFGQQLAEAEREHTREMRRTLLAFLDVLDAFDRFVGAAQAAGQGSGQSPIDEGWLSSAVAVRRQLERALEGVGVQFMACVGQHFDPERHEALGQEEVPGHEAGTVLREEVRGCEWQGQVLRSARVVVSG